MANDGADDPSVVADGIASLAAKSLVARDGNAASRWYLLESIRAYTLEKLAEHSERDWAERRHAAYFRDLFPRSLQASSVGNSGDDPKARFREIENVRAALYWCSSADGDKALGVDLAAGYSVWFLVDVGTSMLAPTRGVRQPLDLLTKALDTAEALDDLDAYARILEALFLHRSFSADKDKAVSTATKLFQVTDRLGDAARHRNASRLMGGALVMVGKPREAQGFLERYLDADTSTPDQGRLSGVSN